MTRAAAAGATRAMTSTSGSAGADHPATDNAGSPPADPMPAAPSGSSAASADPAPSALETRYRALFTATYDPVLRFIERRHHPVGAEDVAAEVFLIAWRRLEEVPLPHDQARAWLCGVAQRVLANQRRADSRRQALHTRVGQHLPGPGQPASTSGQTLAEDAADRAADRVDLQRAWSRLSPTDQEALTLTGLDGLSTPEAATVLGISSTAFSVRLFRARRRLQTHLHRGGTR